MVKPPSTHVFRGTGPSCYVLFPDTIHGTAIGLPIRPGVVWGVNGAAVLWQSQTGRVWVTVL